MYDHLRITSPWKQLLVLFLVFSPQLLLLIFGIFIGNEVETSETVQNMSVDTLKWYQASSSLLFFLLPAFLYVVFVFRGSYFYFLGFKKADKQNMYVLAICAVMFTFPFVFWLGEMNRMIPLPEWMTRMEESTAKQMEDFLKVRNWYDVYVNVIVIALLPAICEELFFRGALQRVLIHLTKNPIIGIILSALLFSALHLQFAGFLPRMFLGIVLGILYWYSGSLWTCILAHFVFNGTQVLMVTYAPKYINENPSPALFAAVVSLIAVTGVLYYYCRQSSVRWKKVYETYELNEHNQFLA
jgi:membrane protease YdiL (CAAX protease family)